MPKRILIDAVYPEETRVVIHENNGIVDFDYETSAKKQIKGNIYLAKVTRVEPSLQAAFIDFGGDKHGFLPFSEIHPDYFQIPIADRQLLKKQLNPELNTTEIIDENIENELGYQIKELTPPDLSQEDMDEEIEPVTENIPAVQEAIESVVNSSEGEAYASDGSDENIAEYIGANELDEIVDDEDQSKKRFNIYRYYKIQEVIKRNQIILVQAIKEERGNKGATFTSFISLAGRYCVLMPNSDKQGGISRRIADFEDRRKIKSIIDSLNVALGASVIVRTAGCKKTKIEIKRDYDYLVRLWNGIRERTLNSTAPSYIHAETDLIKRAIRDLYDSSIDEIIVDGEKAYKSSRDFMKMIIPNHLNKIKQHRAKVPLFTKFNIEDQLSSLYSSVAHLNSGGYIVINQTEALIAIDVNSGKSTSERNVEETATKTNLEAAYEIARQLRLRDLSGLVVIDFIDMLESKNRKLVERALRSYLQHDRAKVQLGSISIFGLLEMSRQRLRPSFIEANTVACVRCNGRGHNKAPETNSVNVLRALEGEICKGDIETVTVSAIADLIIYLANYKRAELHHIENKYNTKINLHISHEIQNDGFSIEKAKRTTGGNKAQQEGPINVEPLYDEYIEETEEVEAEIVEKPARRSQKKSWRSKKPGAEVVSNEVIEEKVEVVGEETDEAKQNRQKRSRNNRFPARGNGKVPNNKKYKTRKKPSDKDKPYSEELASKRKGKMAGDEAGSESLLRGLWRKITE